MKKFTFALAVTTCLVDTDLAFAKVSLLEEEGLSFQSTRGVHRKRTIQTSPKSAGSFADLLKALHSSPSSRKNPALLFLELRNTRRAQTQKRLKDWKESRDALRALRTLPPSSSAGAPLRKQVDRLVQPFPRVSGPNLAVPKVQKAPLLPLTLSSAASLRKHVEGSVRSVPRPPFSKPETTEVERVPVLLPAASLKKHVKDVIGTPQASSFKPASPDVSTPASFSPSPLAEVSLKEWVLETMKTMNLPESQSVSITSLKERVTTVVEESSFLPLARSSSLAQVAPTVSEEASRISLRDVRQAEVRVERSTPDSLHSAPGGAEEASLASLRGVQQADVRVESSAPGLTHSASTAAEETSPASLRDVRQADVHVESSVPDSLHSAPGGAEEASLASLRDVRQTDVHVESSAPGLTHSAPGGAEEASLASLRDVRQTDVHGESNAAPDSLHSAPGGAEEASLASLRDVHQTDVHGESSAAPDSLYSASGAAEEASFVSSGDPRQSEDHRDSTSMSPPHPAPHAAGESSQTSFEDLQRSDYKESEAAVPLQPAVVVAEETLHMSRDSNAFGMSLERNSLLLEGASSAEALVEPPAVAAAEALNGDLLALDSEMNEEALQQKLLRLFVQPSYFPGNFRGTPSAFEPFFSASSSQEDRLLPEAFVNPHEMSLALAAGQRVHIPEGRAHRSAPPTTTTFYLDLRRLGIHLGENVPHVVAISWNSAASGGIEEAVSSALMPQTEAGVLASLGAHTRSRAAQHSLFSLLQTFARKASLGEEERPQTDLWLESRRQRPSEASSQASMLTHVFQSLLQTLTRSRDGVAQRSTLLGSLPLESEEYVSSQVAPNKLAVLLKSFRQVFDAREGIDIRLVGGEADATLVEPLRSASLELPGPHEHLGLAVASAQAYPHALAPVMMSQRPLASARAELAMARLLLGDEFPLAPRQIFQREMASRMPAAPLQEEPLIVRYSPSLRPPLASAADFLAYTFMTKLRAVEEQRRLEEQERENEALSYDSEERGVVPISRPSSPPAGPSEDQARLTPRPASRHSAAASPVGEDDDLSAAFALPGLSGAERDRSGASTGSSFSSLSPSPTSGTSSRQSIPPLVSSSTEPDSDGGSPVNDENAASHAAAAGPDWSALVPVFPEPLSPRKAVGELMPSAAFVGVSPRFEVNVLDSASPLVIKPQPNRTPPPSPERRRGRENGKENRGSPLRAGAAAASFTAFFTPPPKPRPMLASAAASVAFSPPPALPSEGASPEAMQKFVATLSAAYSLPGVETPPFKMPPLRKDLSPNSAGIAQAWAVIANSQLPDIGDE